MRGGGKEGAYNDSNARSTKEIHNKVAQTSRVFSTIQCLSIPGAVQSIEIARGARRRPSPWTLELENTTDQHGQQQISTTNGTRKTILNRGVRKHTCIVSNGIVPARGAHDGARYGRARERTEREDREEHAYAAPDVPRVAERDEGRAEDAHVRAGRCAVEERERDERAGAVRVRPEEGHYACEEDRGRHDVERA